MQVPLGMTFMRQKISNACGTFALLHALANNADALPNGDGIFARFRAGIAEQSPESASEFMAGFKDLAQAHASCAADGETQQSEKVEHHFICLTVMDGHLWEIGESIADRTNNGNVPLVKSPIKGGYVRGCLLGAEARASPAKRWRGGQGWRWHAVHPNYRRPRGVHQLSSSAWCASIIVVRGVCINYRRPRGGASMMCVAAVGRTPPLERCTREQM